MRALTQKCLYCGNEIQGRIDKQYCDSHCKSAYHNQKPNSDEIFIRKINSQIRKNRSAMRMACPQGKATVRKDFLVQLGMDFKSLTHTWKGKGGQVYFFCYDYGYCAVQDSSKVLIIQQQDYMEIPDLIQSLN